MFGGPSVFPGQVTLQRTYSSLQSHNFVYYSINVLAVDNWQSSDTFSIVFDGTVISTWTPATYMSTYGSASVCGGSSNDLMMTIVGRKSHMSGSLTLGIVFDIQSQSTSGASFVIYNAVFSFPSGTITDTDSTHVCFIAGCLIGSTLISPNQYLDSSSTPQACDPSCSRCFGSGSAKCYKCFIGSTSFDGTSCISCPSNCLQCSSLTVCTRCAVGYVLDSTGTCQLSCSTPTDIEMGNNLGTKVCIAPPCSFPQYILWDYTCDSSCDNPPYTQTPSGSLLYCEYPCTYLQYLYEDGSCAYTCEFPYVKRTEPGTKYCDLPCSGTEYVYEDGSCEADCPYYMISTVVLGNIRMCISPTVELTDQVSKMLKASEIGGKMTSVVTKITSFVSPSNPTAVTGGAMIKMLTYLRHLNITRSLKLESYFTNVYIGFDDLLPQLNFANELETEFENKRLPYMFRKYDIKSDFLANYFGDATYLLGYFCAVLVMMGLKWMAKILRNVPYLRSFLKNGRIIVQNFFIGQFYESYGEIIFYSGLAFRSIKVNGGNTTLSFLAAISYTVFGCLLIFGHFYILSQYKKIQKKQCLQVANSVAAAADKPTITVKEKSALDKFKEGYEAWQIFFEDFKDATTLQIDYLLIVVIRTVLFNLILVLLFDYPFMQIIMILCINLLMVIYILVKRPVISLVALYQELIYELILLTANISFLILAVLDRRQVGFSNSVNRISEGVIILGAICRFLPSFFLGMTGIEASWGWYKAVQRSRNNVTGILKSSKTPSMPNIIVHLEEDENNTLPLPAVIEEEDNDDDISKGIKVEMTASSSQAGLFDWSKFETSLNVSSDHLFTTKNDEEVKSVKKGSKMMPVHLLMPEINERVKKKTVFDTLKSSKMFEHFELETEGAKTILDSINETTLDGEKEEEKQDDGEDKKKEKVDVSKDERTVLGKSFDAPRRQSATTEGLDEDERLAKRVLKD